MKTILATLLLITLSISTQAQCDNAYYPSGEGTTWELTNYDKKGKETGKTNNTITSIEQSGSSYNISVNTKILDKKGETVSEGNYTVICDNGTIQMDLQNFVPTEIVEQYQNMKMTFEGDNLEFPANMSAGQTLADATGKMTVQMSEGAMGLTTEMNFLYKDRKVEAQESITTPAGTFETFKISQTIESTIEMMGMKRTTVFTSKTWVAKGKGMVKNESYNKKGKLGGSTMLTAIN